jgi:N6-L-threonylcarbamoyladenine synthase
MILGIETSCDETSVALLERDGRVRANVIASQIARHQPFGGVVPEITSDRKRSGRSAAGPSVWRYGE